LDHPGAGAVFFGGVLAAGLARRVGLAAMALIYQKWPAGRRPPGRVRVARFILIVTLRSAENATVGPSLSALRPQ